MSDTTTILFLVHGTWPRGIFDHVLPPSMRSRELTWFDDGSLFRRELQARLGTRVQFEVFNWSGRNSMKARSEAASKLRDRLIAAGQAYPKARQLIIAHSHGGNIAVQAVARLSSESRVVGVATMATPFLQVRKRPISDRATGVFVSFGAAVLLVFILPFMLLFGEVWQLPPSSAVPAVLIATLLFCVPLAIWKLRLLPAINSLLEKTLADASMPMLTGLPFLVLRCPRDEASLALALAKIFANINKFLWSGYTLMNEKIYTAFALPVASWTIAAAAIALKWGDSLGWSRDAQAAFILVPALLWVLSIPAALPLVWLFTISSGVLLLPFGSELFGLAFQLEASAESTPPVEGYVYASVNPAAEHLRIRRHSVYAVPAARERLAQWIDALIANQ